MLQYICGMIIETCNACSIRRRMSEACSVLVYVWVIEVWNACVWEG